MLIYSEGGTAAQETEAQNILDILTVAYPSHPWGVRVYDGGFFIQYLDRPFNQPYGMNCKYEKFGYSASAMKKAIVMKAGEWLERAGLARGRSNGDEIVWVEGVPEKHRKPLEQQVTVAADGPKLEIAT